MVIKDVRQDICRSISQAIIDRLLEPGTKLPEDTIGAHFGVSRTVVRSAMITLQGERLVEFRKHHGTFVARPTIADARSLFDARRVIERAIVQRAAAKTGAKEIEALLRHTAREDAFHAQHPRDAAVRLSGEFHIRLAELAGNEVLHDMVELLVRRSALVIALYGGAHNSICGAPRHRAIVTAMDRRDVEAACNLMETHLSEVEASLDLEPEPASPQSLADVLSRYSRPSRPAGRATRPRATAANE